MTHRRIQTDDGSYTAHWVERDISYRARSGARTEAMGVFLRSGGLLDRAGAWAVAELGFGVATTFLLCAEEARRHGVSLDYVSVERAPAPPEAVSGEGADAETVRALLQAPQAGWHERVFADGVRLRLFVGDWSRGALEHLSGSRDALFFDPFGPRVEPESWSMDAIGLALDLLAPQGRFTTYTAASDVRRSLLAHGAHVARVRGPAPRPEHIVAAREARLLPQENVRRYDAPSPTPPPH